MEFIGLRLCEHDSNISYANGPLVKYYKSEIDFLIVGNEVYNKNHR